MTCLFWMVQMAGKKAVEMVNVIQIPLTFVVACLLAFMKRAAMKYKNEPSHVS